uniref:Ig-like domain-containing protein n=1 Tax=Labrus bergylta TaxID=56723 RepID=A0A3Q3FJ39_9LABR
SSLCLHRPDGRLTPPLVYKSCLIEGLEKRRITYFQGDSATMKETRLSCNHGDNAYPYMLWYQHKAAAGGGHRAMELIGLLHYEKANMEKNFEARFNITGHSKGDAELVISQINPADSAEYFCAASQHGASSPLTPFTKTQQLTVSNTHLLLQTYTVE